MALTLFEELGLLPFAPVLVLGAFDDGIMWDDATDESETGGELVEAPADLGGVYGKIVSESAYEDEMGDDDAWR